jgi:hypothetical protein
MFVEHASVDTSEVGGIVGLVTYASTTFLDFQTTGTPKGRSCPEVMPPFDGGQTDRKRPRANGSSALEIPARGSRC